MAFATPAKETGAVTFAVRGREYTVLRYPKGEDLSPARTRAIAKSMRGKRLLTAGEAREMVSDYELNAAFIRVLQPGEWGYTRAGRLGFLGSLLRSGERGHESGMNDIGVSSHPDGSPTVVIIKETAWAARMARRRERLERPTGLA